MSKETEGFPSAVTAVLEEIMQALERYSNQQERWTIFLDKMALSTEEQQMIREFLGTGSLKITLGDTAEPAQWQESGVSGIWFGTFCDQKHKPILETIEIGAFPLVAAAQPEDILRDKQLLQLRLSE